ncbi:unnamed protein product, partial [Didymodactylos carnosus]
MPVAAQAPYDNWINIIESAPWLVPPNRYKQFPYQGHENNLDSLLKTMCDGHKRIAILRFNEQWQNMIQNNVYTMTRFNVRRLRRPIRLEGEFK